jgi:hypothetical protein
MLRGKSGRGFFGWGYTPRARKSRFKVTRLTPAGRNTFMLKAGSPVVPGDTIYVDERFF